MVARLTKMQAQLHREACELVDVERDLTEDEKLFVLRHWQESSTAVNVLHGAFFTRLGLAVDLSVHAYGNRIIDLGAGIGHLTWACRDTWGRNSRNQRELVCVESNPTYVRVGRKILPEATWICADFLDLPGMDLGGGFSTAIGNPPFGAIARTGNAPGYDGPRFEYHAIAVASVLARNGAFIVPQRSAPFRYSGERHFSDGHGDAEYERLVRSTGIELEFNCGFDTCGYAGAWRGVAPKVEIVTCDFTDLAARHSPSADRSEPGSPGGP